MSKKVKDMKDQQKDIDKLQPEIDQLFFNLNEMKDFFKMSSTEELDGFKETNITLAEAESIRIWLNEYVEDIYVNNN